MLQLIADSNKTSIEGLGLFYTYMHADTGRETLSGGSGGWVVEFYLFGWPILSSIFFSLFHRSFVVSSISLIVTHLLVVVVFWLKKSRVSFLAHTQHTQSRTCTQSSILVYFGSVGVFLSLSLSLLSLFVILVEYLVVDVVKEEKL